MTLKCVAGGASPPLPPRAGQHRPSVQQDSQVKPQNKYFTGRFKERFYSHNTSKRQLSRCVFFQTCSKGRILWALWSKSFGGSTNIHRVDRIGGVGQTTAGYDLLCHKVSKDDFLCHKVSKYDFLCHNVGKDGRCNGGG